jgi:hypothetical protein
VAKFRPAGLAILNTLSENPYMMQEELQMAARILVLTAIQDERTQGVFQKANTSLGYKKCDERGCSDRFPGPPFA